jgi:hypothetical protein
VAKDINKAIAKAAATDALRDAALDWTEGKITADKRDTVRASAKQTIKYAKRPERAWDRPKRGLI